MHLLKDNKEKTQINCVYLTTTLHFFLNALLRCSFREHTDIFPVNKLTSSEEMSLDYESVCI